MDNWKKYIFLGLGIVCLVLGNQNILEAGLFGKRKLSSVFRSSDAKIQFIEEQSNVKVSLDQAWKLELPSDITGPVWLGTTYREEPYSELEFNTIRDEMINKELDIVKENYVKKKKAEKGKDGGEAAVDDLLSDLLAEGNKEEEEDVSQYLVDFDEVAARRKIASRIFVPQTRYVPIPAVYVTLKNKQVFCIDLNTGITSWVYRLNMSLNGVPFETESHLYIVEAGACYVIDKQTGLANSKVLFDRGVYPTLYANQGRLYPVGYGNRVASWSEGRSAAHWYYKLPGGVEGGVYGHSEGLLLPLMSGELLSLSFEGNEKWKFISKSHSDEKIYLEKIIADKNKEIETEKKLARQEDRKEDLNVISKLEHAIDDIQEKLKQLNNRNRGMFLAKPHIYEDSLVIGSTDFNLYRLNRFSGLPEWSYACGASIKEEASVDSKWVYVKDANRRLHRVSYESGQGEIIARGIDRILQSKGDVVSYEKDRRVWLDWDRSKGYFDGWNSKDLLLSEDMSLLVALKRNGQLHVFKTSEIRQLPQG